MKPRALIRVFNLVLSFDSEKGDSELEQEVLFLIEDINYALSHYLPEPLPQLQLEDPKKRIKIGVKIYKPEDAAEE